MLVVSSLIMIAVALAFPLRAQAQDNKRLNVVSAIDRTFYGDQCDQSEWAWLCQAANAEVAALAEKDGWEMIADDLFTGQDEDKFLEFTFAFPLSKEAIISNVVLKVALRDVNDPLGLAKIWVKIDGQWRPLTTDVGYNWLVFGGGSSQAGEINLGKMMPELLTPERVNGLQVKLLVDPIAGGGQGILTAIDQMILSVDYSDKVEPTPTPTATPAPTLIPSPIYTPTPTPMATPSLSATPTPTSAPPDQEKPEVSWLNPVENKVVFGRVALKVNMNDNSSGIDDEVYPQFSYRRFGQWGWRTILGKTWDTRNVPLGDYQLRARVCDRAGNERFSDINVAVGAMISNVFLTERLLSWQTDRPTIGRVIYDRLSHRDVDSHSPNFGYVWSSRAVDNRKVLRHQFTIPNLPPGKYYYRILAFGSPVSYTPEYFFETDNLLALNGRGDKPSVLGLAVEVSPSVVKKVTRQRENKKEAGEAKGKEQKNVGLNKRRLSVLLAIGFLGGSSIFYLTRNRKKTLMKSNEKK